MKQLTESYLYAEKGYVDNWAHYISSNNMTIDEAIKFVQNINTQGNRYAHFVDMDDFSAISTIADKMEITLLTVTKHFMIQIPMHVMQ